MSSAPDRVQFVRALTSEGWEIARSTRHGDIWQSPNGERFHLANALNEPRAAKNALADLRRIGPDGQAAAEILKPRNDLHLPRINPTCPPAPTETTPTAAKTAERPPSPEVRHPAYGEEAARRVALQVASVVLADFGGRVESSSAAGDRQRSVTADIMDKLGRSAAHVATGLRVGETLGWMRSEFNGPDPRSGRRLVEVTAAGREALVAASVTGSLASSRSAAGAAHISELEELLAVAEAERDEANARADRAETDRDGASAQVSFLDTCVKQQAQRIRELEDKLAATEMQSTSAPAVRWRHPLMPTVIELLQQADQSDLQSVRDALIAAAMGMLPKVAA